jgi:hypothetical protein
MSGMKPNHEERSELVELGAATTATRGLPVGEVIEPMGFWHKAGISDE